MLSLKSIHVIGAAFALILGTLLHFTWEWSDFSSIAAVFSAVNESTWEHLKLIFFPFLLFSIFEYAIYGKHEKCFFTIKLKSVLMGMFVITASFYTYTGILGSNYLPLDIAVFILGVLSAYAYSYKGFKSRPYNCSEGSELLSFAVIAALMLAFWIFTFNPPNLGIFDPPL